LVAGSNVEYTTKKEDRDDLTNVDEAGRALIKR
jgi:hypothetical protein